MTPHPLTPKPWSLDTDPEHGLVALSHLQHLDRTRYAIETIARMVGNSASNPTPPARNLWTPGP